MSDTLVIHPRDESTEMLRYVYEGRCFDVCDDPNIDKETLRKLIELHDTIILLGHGTGAGLAYPSAIHGLKPGPDGSLFMIDDSFAPLLRSKKTISMWCFSDLYFQRNRIKGFHTGMIISEKAEALYMLRHCPLSDEELYDNMVLLSKSLGECIDKEPLEMQSYILEHYVGDDAITEFNRSNIKVL